jgi:hypothetical protein
MDDHVSSKPYICQGMPIIRTRCSDAGSKILKILKIVELLALLYVKVKLRRAYIIQKFLSVLVFGATIMSDDRFR